MGHERGAQHGARIHALAAHRMGIDALHEAVAYMRPDCPACQAEGFRAYGRVLLSHLGREVVATINVAQHDLLGPHQVGLSDTAWRLLAATEDAPIGVEHVPVAPSAHHLRAKMYGHKLDAPAYHSIISDVAARRYSTAELAAFITACTTAGLDTQETKDLTQAMVAVGRRIEWGPGIVADKHCIGGLPGNRTTPIIVAICAAAGIRIPKTSSRAITSPAGTADAMQTLTNVNVELQDLHRIVLQEGGCLAWGGSVDLSPADDILVRVERVLDVDSPGQLVASVLSKKAAAGATHVVIDMPIGPTAKVRDATAARSLQALFESVGAALGLNVRVVQTDGLQPVGRGIGPALEAMDVVAVLQRRSDAPADLRARSLTLAGHLLDLVGAASPGEGEGMAHRILDSGEAWTKFRAICQAQGGLKTPPVATHQHPVRAEASGSVESIDNRRLARLAKLAGAPEEPAAGLLLHVRLGDKVGDGEPLFTLHAQSPGALSYALGYLEAEGNPIRIGLDGPPGVSGREQ